MGKITIKISDVTDTRSIQIRDNNNIIIFTKSISLNSPTVEITNPNGGEVVPIGSHYQINWNAYDSDGNQLFYRVSYSKDNGENWIPLSLAINDKYYIWNTSNLTVGEDYLIRVIVTDGFNTDIDISEGFFSVISINLAEIDIEPNTLNLKSKGKWITCYIELPEGYNVSDINTSTILLNNTVPAETHPTNIGDYDEDGIPDLMVKFDRQDVQDILEPGDNVEIIVSGKLFDETMFEGTDYIKVIE